jgi:hypothetical protein
MLVFLENQLKCVCKSFRREDNNNRKTGQKDSSGRVRLARCELVKIEEL